MDNGFQFIDIILFGMIAAFLIFRLRNNLGKRDGHEGGYRDPFKQDQDNPDQQRDDAGIDADDDDDNVVQLSKRKRAQKENQDDDDQFNADDTRADSNDNTPDDTEYDGNEALADGMMQVQMIDRSFDAGEFMGGARSAFEMILNAYAAGDTAMLKNLLSGEVYSNFSQAIKDREQAGEVLEDTLVGFKKTEYLEAYTEARQAFITMKFVSEQVNVTRDENGDVVDGNASEIITVTDIWTFARDTRSRDPNWSLVATRSMD